MSLFRWAKAEREEMNAEFALIATLRERQHKVLERVPEVARILEHLPVPDKEQRVEIKRKLERLLDRLEREEARAG